MHQFTKFKCKQFLTNLEYVYIADLLGNSGAYTITNLLYGDIGAFANCVKLKAVNIGHSNNLTGDISVFSNCPDLSMVRIVYSPNIYGDIGVFENCNITEIYIGGYHSTNGSPNLTAFLCDSSGVIGSVNSFANHPNLQVLYVNTNLEIFILQYGTGRITSYKNPDFSQLQKLRYVQFVNNWNSNYGDISCFAQCKNLQTFIQHHVQFTIDINKFANHPNLKDFAINDDVYPDTATGSIDSLASCPNIRLINVAYHSSITGSVNSFANKTNLEYLYVNKPGKMLFFRI